MDQKDFIDGRIGRLPTRKTKNRTTSDACTEAEKADFKSGVGDLHWVTSQTRIDHAVDTSKFQKRQVTPTYQDYLELGRVIKEVKETASFAIKIRPIKDPIIGCWTDSALYGAEGELIDNDKDLKGYDKHKVYSQRGTLLALMSRKDLEEMEYVNVSLMDWRTKASRRVLRSTFCSRITIS